MIRKLKLEPEKTMAERDKLIPSKRKTTVIGLKILFPNKLLKRGNNSFKLKYKIKLYLLYQHKKTTKNIYNNLIKSL